MNPLHQPPHWQFAPLTPQQLLERKQLEEKLFGQAGPRIVSRRSPS